MRYEIEPFNRNVVDEELLADLQRVATELEKRSVTAREYNAEGRFHSNTLMERFGGWTAACTRAGLSMRLSPKDPADEDLLRNIEEVWIKLGRQPRFRDIRKPISKFTTSPYLTRYDTWGNALNAFVTHINDEQTPQSEDAIKDWKVEPATKHKTHRTINLRLRVKVLMRDNHRCQICGRSPATDSTIVLHVDHIKAWANGGETVLENLQTLCSKCNLGKSDLEFINMAATEVQNV